MQHIRQVIVIGGSAGALGPLAIILRALPKSLETPIIIVIHTTPDTTEIPALLKKESDAPIEFARLGQTIEAGHVYFAPADKHVIVKGDKLLTSTGPRENGFRPAIDPLFRSAALSYKNNSIGVLLSGALEDGIVGLMSIKGAGGSTIVQDPADAEFSSLPAAAVKAVAVDHVLDPFSIADKLVELSKVPSLFPTSTTANVDTPAAKKEIGIAAVSPDQFEKKPLGEPSEFACPDCGGVLWEIQTGDYLRFRCRVGHAFSPDALWNQQSSAAEMALWSGIRALQEKAALCRRLAQRLEKSNRPTSAKRFEAEAVRASNESFLVLRVLAERTDLNIQDTL